MKTKLFSMAALLCGITACTSDEVVLTPETARTPIGFNAYTGNMTRAEASFDGSHQPNAFMVWAFQGSDPNETVKSYFGTEFTLTTTNATNLLDATRCDWYIRETQNDSWTSEHDVRYWPTDGSSLNFFALAGLDLSNYSDSSPKIEFGIDGNGTPNRVYARFTYNPDTDDATKHNDIMFAVVKDASESNLGPTNGKVQLEFKHLLSQICFEATNKNTTYDFKIVEITLTKMIKSNNCYIYNIVGTDNEVDIQWDGNPTTNISLKNLDIIIPKAEGDSPSIMNISNPSKATEENRSEVVNRALNLIPGTLTSGTKNNFGRYSNCQIYIRYKKIKDNTELNGDFYGYFPLDIEWKPGYRYVQNLIFNNSGAIDFETSCEDYVTPSSENGDASE